LYYYFKIIQLLYSLNARDVQSNISYPNDACQSSGGSKKD